MRAFIIPLLLAATLAGCGSSSAPSGGPSNTASAPALNHVHSIVILPHNPSTLYLGTHYHLYKSTNGGKTWQALSKQMMLSMAMDMATPTTMYAVSLQNGLLKTTDGGVHWRSIAHGVPKGRATGVVVSPDGRVVLAYGNGIYRSTDGGAHWSQVLRGQSLDSAAFGAGSTAYAGSTGAGVFVSHDAGAHWRGAGALRNVPVLQVAAARSTAYAATAVGLMRSTNLGRSWTTLTKAPFGIEFLGVAPADPREVIGEVGGKGFYVSYDGGASWHRASAGIHDTNFNASTVRIAPSSPQVAYTGAWGLHFYVSHDAGRSWTRVSTLVQ